MFNLYLDDLRRGPNNGFDQKKPPVGWENWVVVRCVENAKRLLRVPGLVDNMSLDHDLGYNSETGQENPNGKKLILWMIETGCWPAGWIHLHSNHYKRCEEMKELLDQYRPGMNKIIEEENDAEK